MLVVANPPPQTQRTAFKQYATPEVATLLLARRIPPSSAGLFFCLSPPLPPTYCGWAGWAGRSEVRLSGVEGKSTRPQGELVPLVRSVERSPAQPAHPPETLRQRQNLCPTMAEGMTLSPSPVMGHSVPRPKARSFQCPESRNLPQQGERPAPGMGSGARKRGP